MFSRLYIEQTIADHPVTRRIQARFPSQRLVVIERYGEVFNRKAQNFLFSLLRDWSRSAHYVLFVNFDDFQAAMAAQLAQHASPDSVCFFSGYDCDSLALEPVSGYVADLLPFFERHPETWLELRTKSTQIRPLLRRPALANVVVAFSFTPAETARELEHKVPSVERRISAIKKLADRGWPLGLRFDPLIYSDDYQTRYARLFKTIFQAIEPDSVHSVSLGPFRLPKGFYRTAQKLYPDEPLFALGLSERTGMVSYPETIEQAMRAFCTDELLTYLPESALFPCEF